MPLSANSEGYVLLSSLSHSVHEGRPRKRGKRETGVGDGGEGGGEMEDADMGGDSEHEGGGGRAEGGALAAKVSELGCVVPCVYLCV